MRLRYDFTQRAVADLAEIACFTGDRWGAKQARFYREELELRVQKLALSPAVGRHRGDIGPSVRSFPVARHIVFYVESGDGITVLRILHSSMDVALAFPGDEA